jgi:hypothetical protein
MQFLTRQGSLLFEGEGKPFRFMSFNVPNLHFIEDTGIVYPWWAPASVPAVSFVNASIPLPYEQEDALSSLSQLGGRVVRTYTLGIGSAFHIDTLANHNSDSSSEWVLIQGSNNPRLVFRRNLLEALDEAVALSSLYGVRIVFPIIDRWDWWGGISSFVALHSNSTDPTSPNSFFSDPAIISNFKAVISFILNRNNSRSGILYKNDPAFLVRAYKLSFLILHILTFYVITCVFGDSGFHLLGILLKRPGKQETSWKCLRPVKGSHRHGQLKSQNTSNPSIRSILLLMDHSVFMAGTLLF